MSGTVPASPSTPWSPITACRPSIITAMLFRLPASPAALTCSHPFAPADHPQRPAGRRLLLQAVPVAGLRQRLPAHRRSRGRPLRGSCRGQRVHLLAALRAAVAGLLPLRRRGLGHSHVQAVGPARARPQHCPRRPRVCLAQGRWDARSVGSRPHWLPICGRQHAGAAADGVPEQPGAAERRCVGAGAGAGGVCGLGVLAGGDTPPERGSSPDRAPPLPTHPPLLRAQRPSS